MKQVLLFGLSDTAAAHTPHAVVAAGVEEVVLIEVGQTINLGFFVLKMNEG